MYYQTRFFTNLEKIYNEIGSFHPNVTLHCIADNTKKKCHGIVLSAASEYFNDVFRWGTSEVIEVHHGITGDIVDVVLKYIYSGEIFLSSDNVIEVLASAYYFKLSELVHMCIPVLSNKLTNTDLQSCLEMALLFWRLHIPPLLSLLDKIVPRLAASFPTMLSVLTLNAQLMTSPPQLMAKVLKSKDLLLLDKDTNLPSGPVQRERGVLEFILHYTSHLEKAQISVTGNDVLSLLHSVQWSLLNIFEEEEELVLDYFSTFFDDLGEQKEEVRNLSNVVHSDWYLSSSSLEYGFDIASPRDKEVYRTRAYTCSELVKLHNLTYPLEEYGLPYMDTKEKFKIISRQNERISGLDILTKSVITNSAEEVIIVGGLVVYIASGSETLAAARFGISEDVAFQVHKVKLRCGEYITRVTAHMKDDEFYTYPFKFYTNENQCFGPFGEHPLGGNDDDIHEKALVTVEKDYVSFRKYRKPRYCTFVDSFLVGVKGKIGELYNDLAIKHIQFIFRDISRSNFLVNNVKKFCRIDDNDSDGSDEEELVRIDYSSSGDDDNNIDVDDALL